MTGTIPPGKTKRVARSKYFAIKAVPVGRITGTISLPGDFGPDMALDIESLPPARARWHQAKIDAILDAWMVCGGKRITSIDDPVKDNPIVLIEFPDGTFVVADDGNHRVHVAKHVLHLPFVMAKVFKSRKSGIQIGSGM
jgi:hypothetical protein